MSRLAMRHSSAEFKASSIAKMLPPHKRPVPDLARATPIPRDTLYRWRTQVFKAGGDLVSVPTPDERDSAEQCAIVVETAPLNAEELSTSCRRQGRYSEPLEVWRSACVQANALAAAAALLMLPKKVRQLLRDPADACSTGSSGAT
jgi:transposase-like protein